jgi:hypothetical protein
MRFLRNLGIMVALVLCLGALCGLTVWLGILFENYPGGHYYGLVFMIVLVIITAAALLTVNEK